MRKIALTLAIVVSLIITASCATEIRYQSDPLPLPVSPVLPGITAEELGRIADDVAWKIVERDRMRSEYAEELEAIIKATHKE